MEERTKRSNRSRINFSIPVEERIRYYFILGFRANEIAQFLRNEFRELELLEYSRYNVEQYLRRHRDFLNEEQHKFRMEIRAKINDGLRENFNNGMTLEIDAVNIYIKKAKDVLSAIDDLDILAKDEDGNFLNRGQFITLMMIFKEQQAMIGKLAQTDAAREYALYCRKMQVKANEAKGAGMLTGEEAEVTFMDQETQFYGDGPRNITPPKP